jgi:hypothetical protein
MQDRKSCLKMFPNFSDGKLFVAVEEAGGAMFV